MWRQGSVGAAGLWWKCLCTEPMALPSSAQKRNKTHMFRPKIYSKTVSLSLNEGIVGAPKIPAESFRLGLGS